MIMVVAMQEPITDVDRVAAAVLDVYVKRRELATEMPLIEILDVPVGVGALRVVACVREQIVEIVLDADVDAAALASAVWALSARGWRVVVLVALERIGAAHGELRGTPCRLQPWWLVDGAVVFGGFESA
jgi:hypothetical protein